MKFASLFALGMAGAVLLSNTAFADQLDDIKKAGALNCGVLTNSPRLGFRTQKHASLPGMRSTCAPCSPNTLVSRRK